MESNITFNQPIVYALMPLKRPIKCSYNGYGADYFYETYTYVIAPCYHIGTYTENLTDGSSRTSYDVVFTWNQNKNNIFPEYTFDWQECINKQKVNIIFNDLNIAREYLKKINHELLLKNLATYPIKEYKEKKAYYESLIEEAEKKAELYLQEQYLLSLKKKNTET